MSKDSSPFGSEDMQIGISVDATEAVKGAQQAADAIQSVAQYTKDSAVPAMEHLAESTQEVSKATKESTHWHGQAKAALKGLATEFPELAHAAHLAMNPITLAIAGIVGAIAIWRKRVADLTNALSQAKISDSELLDHKRVSATKDEWVKYGEQVDAVSEKLNGLAARHDDAMKKIEGFFALVKQLGGDGPTTEKHSNAAQLGELSSAAYAARVAADTKGREARDLSGRLQNSRAGQDPASRAADRAALEKQIQELEAGVKAKEELVKNDPRNNPTFAGRMHFGGDAAIDAAKTVLPEEKALLEGRRRALAALDSADKKIVEDKEKLAKLLAEEVAQRERYKVLSRQYYDARADFRIQDAIGKLDGARPVSFKQGTEHPKYDPFVGAWTGERTPGYGMATLNTGAKIPVTPTGEGASISAYAIPALSAVFRNIDLIAAEKDRRIAVLEAKGRGSVPYSVPSTGANIQKTGESIN